MMNTRVETTTRKRNEKKTFSSRAATSFRRTENHAAESSTSRDISSLRNTFSKKDKPLVGKACKGYENEYSLYLLRRLQRKIVENESKEREEQVKRSLVGLKKEYEELLEERVRLYKECKKTQVYGKVVESLDKDLAKGREVLNVLREADFLRVIEIINEDLEKAANSVTLVDLGKKDIENAFEKGILGFNSSVFKLLKEMENYANRHNELITEIVQELKDIERINAENEILRKKCCKLVEGVRSNVIRTNYDKFYKMALEACKDVRDATSVILPEDGSYVRKSEGSGFKPISSSTPS